MSTTTTVGAAGSPFLTAEEACTYLRRTNVKAFYRAVIDQRIPHRRDGQRFLFVPAELDQWLLDRASFVPREEAGHSQTGAKGLRAVERRASR